MKQLIAMALIILLPQVVISLGQDRQQEKTDNDKSATALIGDWEGMLNAGAVNLTLIVHVKKDDAGKLQAVMDSPDQGAKGIPIDAISLTDRKVHFEIKAAGGTFDGQLNDEATEIAGEWTQGHAFPLTLKKGTVAKVAPRRPQEPQPPYPYLEEDITFANQAAGITLAGTLTMPRTGALHPAVILITGSGPQNRNEELLGHKPFLVLADHLTRKGVAVLRYDDRGVGKSTGKFATATSRDFASDVMAAINFLKSRKDIDAKQIGLIGHSEGGLIAPMVAAQSEVVAFIVLMAGPGVTGEEILYEQAALISRAAGADDEAIRLNRKVQEKMFAVLKQEPDAAKAETRLKAIADEMVADLTEDQQKAFAAVRKNFDAQVKSVNSPWFRFFLTYDPRPVLAQIRVPLLAVNGELDLQVPPEQNLPVIAAAMQKAGNQKARTVRLPRLNHLFQTATTGGPSEYAKIEETISPVALDTIADWVLSVTARK